MFIRCWGSRGSVPVSGKEYVKYGGDTTCLEIRAQSGEVIIIDAGTGIRALGNKIMNEQVRKMDILFTHAHWDHLIGFPFFKPIFKKETTINIHYCSFHKSTVKAIFNTLMSRPYFPVQLTDKDIKADLFFNKLTKKTFCIGSITIDTIPLSHPKDGGVGFRLQEEGKTFIFLTDNELGHVHNGGCTFEEYCRFCENADLLIHDAEYEKLEYEKILKTSEEPWGHSIVTDVVRLAIEAQVKKLGLFHLNAMRTDAQVDLMVNKARKVLKKAAPSIQCLAIGSDFEIIL